MIVKDIKIENFRNIKKAEINFSEKINYIIGNNAQGKTNLVESIYYLSLLKSFRTKKNNDLIMNDKDHLKLSTNITSTIINNNYIETVLYKNKFKDIKINNKKPIKYQLYNTLSCSVFYNDEINYLKFYPSYRRNFIDKSIFYTNNNYLVYIRNYNKCLKQRNSELKKNSKNDIWIEPLIEYAYLIIKERILYIERINKILDSNNNIEKYYIKYSFNSKSDIKQLLKSKYEKVKDKEYKFGYTMFGPHTDDYLFTIDNHDFRKYSSEGQKLYFLLNLKYSQLIDFESINNYKPILIFDDIGKELDSQRKKEIFEKFINKNCQIFITSTIIECFSENSKILKVENGQFFDSHQG
jgi:DNA replication and repair protein RecF